MVQKRELFKLIKEYCSQHKNKKNQTAGNTKIHYAGRVYDSREVIMACDAALDFWLTLGKYDKIFRNRLTRFLGVKEAILVNSGSSANLVAIATLMSNRLKDRLRPGDEIVTCVLGFPTTIAPMVQSGLIPVLVDCRLDTFNIDETALENALSKRTRAIQVTHTLGNPCAMEKITRFAKKHNLYLIEDVCDALGSKFDGEHVGSFGDIATLSFYPAHHITMGEGGAVVTSNKMLARIARSIRDWGRDCFCGDNSGPDGACGKRFDYFINEIDSSYDHRYVYTDIGYNLKPTDIQAAIGVAQFDKLKSFIKKRKENFCRLYRGLSKFKKYISLPEWSERADVSWFAFPVLIKDSAPFRRRELVKYLEGRNIETRFVFAGNILTQPAYRNIRCRKTGPFKNSNKVMKNAFFVGLYPGIGSQEIDYIVKSFGEFLS